jgi:hypothetical protein
MKGSVGTPTGMICTRQTWKAFKNKVNSVKGRIGSVNGQAALTKKKKTKIEYDKPIYFPPKPR